MPRLKDYRWSQTGTTEVYDDLTLTNTNFLCNSVNFQAQTRVVVVELMFWEGEGIYNHARQFYFPLPDDNEVLTTQSILDIVAYFFTGATQSFVV